MVMKRHVQKASAFLALLLITAAAQAASPYDAYYNTYHQTEDDGNAPASHPVDNDNYYTPPSMTDNDAYYSAPGSYQHYYPPTQQRGGGDCNTIGEMPSCGAND